MLRLEKALKTREINILLRQKDPFFNRIFCLALLWAMGIHLFGLLLFNIAPFKVNYSDSIFPPVAVASDLGMSSDGLALAMVDEEIKVPQHLLLPWIADLSAPAIPAGKPVKLLEYHPEAPVSSHPFLSAELTCLAQGCLSLEPGASPPIKIQVSGPLADYVLSKQAAVDIPSSLDLLQKREFTMTYEVRVDGKTGQPMWLQAKEKMHPQIARWGEELVRGMAFSGTAREIVIPGTIEIFISLPERSVKL